MNISLSVGLAKPTYLFLIYISLFNQTLSPIPSPIGEGNCRACEGLTPHPTHKPLTKQFTGLFCSAESKEREFIVLRRKREGNCYDCSDSPLVLAFPPRGRNTIFLHEILRSTQYDKIWQTNSPLRGTLAEPTKQGWVEWNCVPYGWGWERGRFFR